MEPFPKCSEFRRDLIVAIKQRGKAETAISGVTKMIDSIINHGLFIIAN